MPATVDSHAPVAPATRRAGGAITADALVEPWFASLKPRLAGTRLFDADTHVGCADPDGSCFRAAELRAALRIVDAPGVVFPLTEPGSWAAACRLTAGYSADEYLELARLPCELPEDHRDAAAASVRELLDRYAVYTATDPPRRGPRAPGVHMIFVAAAVAHTRLLLLPERAR